MIRFIVTVVSLVIFLLVSLPIQGVLYLIGKSKPEVKDRVSLSIVQWAFRVVMKISGLTVKVIGEENVPKDEPVLYIGNHRSYFDIIMTYARVPRLTSYISKQEVNKVPIFRIWMRYLHCLFLNRDDLKEGLKVILNAIELIKNGISVCIFPEGTRSKDGSLLPFKEGSFKIAHKTGCLIQPFAITNSSAVFEDHFPKIKKTTVILEYGKPFRVKDLDPEDQKHVGAYSRELIANMLKNHDALL